MSRKKWVSASSKGDQKVTAPTGPVFTSEDIVLLLSGFNNFGDKIYNYLKLPVEKVDNLIEAVKNGGRFDIREYGEVVAAGLGVPTPEIKKEIEGSYKMLSIPETP